MNMQWYVRKPLNKPGSSESPKTSQGVQKALKQVREFRKPLNKPGSSESPKTSQGVQKALKQAREFRKRKNKQVS